MKKFCVTITVLLVMNHAAHAQLSVVFDPTNYLTAIDQLYTAYDQVMNSIQQIQFTYEQLQHYYNEARTWKLEEVQWDGDWDFRNEIKSVTSSVNRQINNIRMLEYNLTQRQLSFGGEAFTIKDLIDVQHMGTMLVTVESDNLKKAAAGFEGRLKEEEKAAIWRKYGLSPVNYYYVKAKEAEVGKMMTTLIAWGLEESIKQNMEADQERNRVLTEAAMSEDSTEKMLLQQQIVQSGIFLETMHRLEALLAQTGAMTAMQQSLENQEKEAERNQRDLIRIEREKKHNPGTIF
jgi:conjugal transfer/entry exclusion protein